MSTDVNSYRRLTKKFDETTSLKNFESLLEEKNIRNPTTAVELAAVLIYQSFTQRSEKKMDRCTQKTPVFHQFCFE